MIFVLGVLVAGLLALLVTPAIWRRALRLARTRIEAKVPLSRAEIDADKDQLRAGFAINNRRLEMEADRLRERVAESSIALSRRSDEVAALMREKATVATTIAGLEARIGEISGALTETAERLQSMTSELSLREGRLAEQDAALAGVRTELASAQLMTEELRLEMVARQTEIGNLADSLSQRAAAEAAAAAARDQLAQELAEERERLAAENVRLTGLRENFDALHAERTGQLAELERATAEVEQHGARVRALEAEMETARAARQALAADVENVRADRARLAAELSHRSTEISRLAEELETTSRHRDELHGQVVAFAAGAATAEAGDNLRKALSATEAEKDDLVLRIQALEQDLATLRHENADLRRVAGAEWESEREDNRRLRERLNEIAAGVVRLTQATEALGNETPGGASANRPIPLVPVQRPAAPATAGPETGDATLAERLRALHAARH